MSPVIDHLGINCADWDKSKAFYDKVLGVLGYTRFPRRPARGLDPKRVGVFVA